MDAPAKQAPSERPVHRPTGASLIAVIGVVVAFVGVMVMHAVRSDVDPLRDVMSHYANGSNGPVMSIVFYAFGATALGLAIRLRTAIDQHGVTRAFPVLLGPGRDRPARRRRVRGRPAARPDRPSRR